MLLWLDDQRPAPVGWVWARSAGEAAAALATGTVVYASLDHDLGILEPTGFDLIQWMAQNNRWPRHRPGVHSANLRGVANMVGAIIEYGPYG